MKRKSVLKLLTASLAVAAAFGGVAALDTQTANASTSTFEMDTVAAVRVDKKGIRFYAHFDETTKTQAETNGYGFLVFPQEYLNVGTADEVTGDYHNKLTKFVEIEGTKAIYANDDGVWTANAVITEILTTSFEIPFTCVAYVGNATSGYDYATIDETFSRSAYQVASAAYIGEADKRDTLLTTYKTSYGFGTADMPILIQDSEDLELISAEVTNEGTTFEGVYFQIANDITLSNSYTPIPATFKGTLDGNEKTITGNFDATVLADETVTLNVTEKVVLPEKFLDVTQESYDNGSIYSTVATVTQYSSYVSNENLPDVLKNDTTYTGGAYKWEHMFNTSNPLSVKNDYTDARLALIEENYDYVKFYMAVVDSGETSGWYYWLFDGLLSIANEVTDTATSSSTGETHKVFKFNSTSSNKWNEFTVPASDFVALMTGQTGVSTFTRWYSEPSYNWYEPEGCKLDFYFGDIQFYTEIPTTLAKIESTGNWSGKQGWVNSYAHAEYFPFIQSDYLNYYVAEADVAALGIEGTYSGGNIAYVKGNYAMNANNFCAKNGLTDNQLNYIIENKDSYESVRFYVAVVDQGTIGEGWSFTIGSSKNGILQYSNEFVDGTFTFNADNDNQWIEFNVPIDKFIENLDAAITAGSDVYNRIALFNKITCTTSAEGATDYIYFYFGESQFIKKAA